MSIESVITRFAVQDAVHWGVFTRDGYGSLVYEDPVEIKVRWEELTKLISNRKAEEVISTGQILTNTEIEEEDMIFLGSLEDLEDLELDVESGYYYPDPMTVNNAYKVVAKSKIPMVRSTTDFVRMYYLKPNWEQKV